MAGIGPLQDCEPVVNAARKSGAVRAEFKNIKKLLSLSTSCSEDNVSQSLESHGATNIRTIDAPEELNMCTNDAYDKKGACIRLNLGLNVVAEEMQFVNEVDDHDNTLDKCANNVNVHDSTLDSVPVEGTQFDNEEAAYKFYNDYALKLGFSVRRYSWSKNAQGVVVRKAYVCSKQGWKKSSGNSTRSKPDSRCGCPARMVLRRLPNGKYFVRTLINDHNHELADSFTTPMLRSHRKVIEAHTKIADSVDIAPRKTYNLCAPIDGGCDDVSFTPVDLRNRLRRKMSDNMKNGEICSLVDYLQKKSSNDPGFFSAMQLDEDGYVVNMFWADSRSRIDYECFNDVLVFDTTVKINTKQWPFAQFVGVNHHSQSCILGGAFLYDQTNESFKWLFRVFTQAMNGKHPKVVLTDGDHAIAAAVSHVWPDAHHRLCLWHIFQNAKKNIGHIFNEKTTEFDKMFRRCVLESVDEVTFMSDWEEMIQMYNLQDCVWLQNLYADKEKWALAYGRKYFCAGMISTQRVESMHDTLKKTLYLCLTMFHFMEQYELFVDGLRQNELEQDVKCFNTRPVTLGMKILMRPADLYTLTVFEWIKNEVIQVMNCNIEGRIQTENMHKFHILWKGEEHPKKQEAHVTYNVDNGTFECTCKMYEFKGILCRHALKTLYEENIQEIPESYLMRRWTRQAKIELLDKDNVSQSDVDEKCHIAFRYQQLCRSLVHVADLASKSEEAYVCMRKVSRELLENVQLIHYRSVAAYEDQSKKMRANNEGENNASPDLHEKLRQSVNIIFNKSGVNICRL